MNLMLKQITLFIIICVFSNPVFAGDDAPVLAEFKYQVKDNVLQAIQSKQLKAKNSGKLLLLALGAEWCHDSRGLAQRFSNPELTEKLKAKYEIEFVDVGYLDKAFDVASQYQHQVYWGTPSVLIIDPSSGELLNKDTIWHWTNADSIELAEYNEYFLQQAFKLNQENLSSALYQGYLKQIKMFESQQSLKLKAAYKVVGPLLKEYKESGQRATDEFKSAWDEVWQFRKAYNDDLSKLYQTAKTNTEKGVKEKLVLPAYEKFSWE